MTNTPNKEIVLSKGYLHEKNLNLRKVYCIKVM